METNQPITTAASSATGKLSSFRPGSVSFLAAILLFLLPFVNIKCGDATLKEVRGFELATGFTIQNKDMNQSLFGNMETEQGTKETSTEKRDPDMFAMAALGLGIIGFLVSFRSKGRSVFAAVIGALASISLIALMINLKNDQKLESASGSNNNNTDSYNLNLGNDIVRIEFTAWFYIAVVLFLAAAYFNWRKNKNTNVTPSPKPPGDTQGT